MLASHQSARSVSQDGCRRRHRATVHTHCSMSSHCTLILTTRQPPGAVRGSNLLRAECKSPRSTGQAGSARGWRVQAGTVTVLDSLCKSLSGAASSDGRHMATYSSYAIEYAVLCVQAIMNLSRERGGGGLPA